MKKLMDTTLSQLNDCGLSPFFFQQKNIAFLAIMMLSKKNTGGNSKIPTNLLELMARVEWDQ